MGLSATPSGSSPFASITGRGSSPRRKSGRSAAEVAQSDAANGHSGRSRNGKTEHAGGMRAYIGKGLSNGSASRSAEADVSSDEIHMEEDQNGWRLSVQLPDQQPGPDNLPRQQSLPVGKQTAHHTAAEEEQIENGDVSSRSEEQAGLQRDADSDEPLSSVWSEVTTTSHQGGGDAGGPHAASRVGLVRWLRPRKSLPLPLQVQKGRPAAAPRHAPASNELPVEGAGDRTTEDSNAEQLAGASAADTDVSVEADAARSADATAPDVSGDVGTGAPATDALMSTDDSAALPQPPDDSDSQGASVAESTEGNSPANTLQVSQPTSHDVFSSLIRQRQERKAGKLRASWSSKSWDARWYGGAEGPMHQHGGSRTPQQDWHPPRESLRRTTRSSLRHGRSTVQVRSSQLGPLPPHFLSWGMALHIMKGSRAMHDGLGLLLCHGSVLFPLTPRTSGSVD